jgi:hypothetical protein
MGLLVHQPRSVRNGIQKSRNWMLMSIARAWARLSGGGGSRKRKYALSVWRAKYVTATVASAENDTIGRRTIPNHLRKDHVVSFHGRYSCEISKRTHSSSMLPRSRTYSMLSTSYGGSCNQHVCM